jgi:hypothetical protein
LHGHKVSKALSTIIYGLDVPRRQLRQQRDLLPDGYRSRKVEETGLAFHPYDSCGAFFFDMGFSVD